MYGHGAAPPPPSAAMVITQRVLFAAAGVLCCGLLACVPLCHSYGIEHGLLAPTWAGSAVHLARGFDLRVVQRELTESPVSIFPGVPFMFEMLARLLGRPEWATDERFATNPARVRNKELLIPMIQEALLTLERDEVVARLGNAGIPCAPVHDTAVVPTEI